jgi:glucose-1-phosphate cytidylyltransferase
MASMKVVLFCGGLGMRMREGAGSVPKPMAMIGDRPLLWHVMRYYAHFGYTDFILCLGYGAAAVKDFFLRYDETLSNNFRLAGGGRDVHLFNADITDWNITFINTGLHATIGERLARVREQLAGEELFLANYADTLTDAYLPDMVERLRRTDAVVSLLAVPPVSSHHLVEIEPTGAVTRIRELSALRQWENGGYFVLRPAVFDELRPGEDLVPHALDRLLPRRAVLAQPHTGFWRAVDTFKDRAELEDMYLRGHCPWMLWDLPARDRQLVAG